MSPNVEKYWERFRSEAGRGGNAPFDIFKIGDSTESANEGLALILSGEKTATSSLPEEFTESRPPRKGDFCIVLDGADMPGAVVETTDVTWVSFSDVTHSFARAYGEWDRTLKTWREENSTYYATLCEKLGVRWHEDKQLICEIFELVHTASGGPVGMVVSSAGGLDGRP